MLLPIRYFVTCVLTLSTLLGAGCIYTPAKSVERHSLQIGDSPQAIIRVGEANRETVLQLFGKPSYSTQNNFAFGYLFAVKTGTAKGLLMGPCIPYFGKTDVIDNDDVWLEFDENGILKRVEKQLIKKNHEDVEAAWRQFAKTVPDPIRGEQMLNGKP